MNERDYTFKTVIPIAESSFGNLICLNLDSGFVVFWDHEDPSGNEENKIADDIQALIQNLKPFDVDTIEIEAKGSIIKANPEFMEEQRKLGNLIDRESIQIKTPSAVLLMNKKIVKALFIYVGSMLIVPFAIFIFFYIYNSF